MNRKQTGIFGAVLAIIALACIFFLGKDYLSGNTDSDVSYIAQQSDEMASVMVPEQSVQTQAQTETEIETEAEKTTETQIETATAQDDTVSQTKPAETQQESETAQIETVAQTETAVQPVAPVEARYKFRKPEYLTEHFIKHGAEFPYATEEEYLMGANNVIGNPNALHKLEAEDGDDVYYVESTNEFVIVSTDGYIRTYFKPNGGIDYYNRQ